MPRFPKLSDKFLGDISIERIVKGMYSLKSLVILEMLEKSGGDQYKKEWKMMRVSEGCIQILEGLSWRRGGKFVFRGSGRSGQNKCMGRNHQRQILAEIIMSTTNIVPNMYQACAR